ncbi:MAG: hypothetical protein LBU95_05360 [Rikenellaceae bacterium]|jgi:hypothetical protein|nr:hypothetical protein [Rikenellaceae bacterium]
MKKLYSFALAVLCCSALGAQIQKDPHTPWIDLQLVQHIGINSWSDSPQVADRMQRPVNTDLRGVFNWNFASPVGLFGDMAVGFAPAARNAEMDPNDFPGARSSGHYYLRETVSDGISRDAGVNFKMTAGVFGNFRNEKLSVRPYFGVGFVTMTRPYYEGVIKQQNTNNQYNARYDWITDDPDAGSSATLGYLSARVNFAYKLGDMGLLLGLEYTYYFTRADFYATYTNSFNDSMVRNYSLRGNQMKMLGISVGITFR